MFIAGALLGAMFVPMAPPASAIIIPPAITGFSPASGYPGTVVTITGTALSGASTVTFNGVPAMFLLSGSTTIRATVPAAATTGPIAVTNLHGTATSATDFVVVSPQLVLSPSAGPPTTTVTVSGSGFAGSEFVDLYFDTTNVVDASTTAAGTFSGVSLTVPASATPGAHWISAKGERSGLAGQSAFTVRTNWNGFHNSALHRGRNSYENVLSPSTVPGIDRDWSYSTGGAAVGTSPAVVNGVVYFGSGVRVFAVSATTGALLWVDTTSQNVFTSPAVANGVVYVASFDGNVDAFNATTGAALWTVPAGGIIHSSPTVANGVVYIGSDNDKVYAFNATTGAELWVGTTGGSVITSPAVANGVVYVGSNDDFEYAFNATTGTELWAYSTGFPVQSSAALANGMVYVGCGAAICALNASTGALVWSYSTGNAVNSSPALGGNGLVYVGSADDKVYALNSMTGAFVWSYTTGNYVLSSPAVANGVVYVGSNDDKVYAFGASTGTLLWSYTTGNIVSSSPAVANGVVYVGSNDASLYAFDLAGGTEPGARPAVAGLRPNPALHLSLTA